MSSAATSRWKNCERGLAKLLCKYGIPAKRRVRSGNYSESVDDIEIDGHPQIINDSKYSIKGFHTNRLLAVMIDKYCKTEDSLGFLWTKGYREEGMKATMDGEVAAMLLSYWLGFGTKEELENIRLGRK